MSVRRLHTLCSLFWDTESRFPLRTGTLLDNLLFVHYNDIKWCTVRDIRCTIYVILDALYCNLMYDIGCTIHEIWVHDFVIFEMQLVIFPVNNKNKRNILTIVYFHYKLSGNTCFYPNNFFLKITVHLIILKISL